MAQNRGLHLFWWKNCQKLVKPLSLKKILQPASYMRHHFWLQKRVLDTYNFLSWNIGRKYKKIKKLRQIEKSGHGGLKCTIFCNFRFLTCILPSQNATPTHSDIKSNPQNLFTEKHRFRWAVSILKYWSLCNLIGLQWVILFHAVVNPSCSNNTHYNGKLFRKFWENRYFSHKKSQNDHFFLSNLSIIGWFDKKSHI